jgi:hypothetical protein
MVCVNITTQMECENGQLKNIDDVVTKELSNDIKKKTLLCEANK